MRRAAAPATETVSDILDRPEVRRRIDAWAQVVFSEGDAGFVTVRIHLKDRRATGVSLGGEQGKSRKDIS